MLAAGNICPGCPQPLTLLEEKNEDLLLWPNAISAKPAYNLLDKLCNKPFSNGF
jgi:hypothetical protein